MIEALHIIVTLRRERVIYYNSAYYSEECSYCTAGGYGVLLMSYRDIISLSSALYDLHYLTNFGVSLTRDFVMMFVALERMYYNNEDY